MSSKSIMHGSFKSGKDHSVTITFTHEGMHDVESSDEETSESDDFEEAPPSSEMKRTTGSDKATKQSVVDFSKLDTRTSFVKQIGRTMAQAAIGSSYDRLKSVNFLIPGAPGNGGSGGSVIKKRPGTRGDPSTDPRLRTVGVRSQCARHPRHLRDNALTGVQSNRSGWGRTDNCKEH